MLNTHFCLLSLTINSSNIVFFASVLSNSIHGVLITAEKVVPKQFQLRDIVMGRFTPGGGGSLVPCYPMVKVVLSYVFAFHILEIKTNIRESWRAEPKRKCGWVWLQLRLRGSKPAPAAFLALNIIFRLH